MNARGHFVRAASLADLEAAGCLSAQVDRHTVALFLYDGQVYAVDNRCPHMGFPLDRGTVQDGILTCYWHYARFDLTSGGTFDQFADDVRTFPVALRDGDIYVDVSPPPDRHDYYLDRLQVGLERSLSLVIGKSVIHLLEGSGDPVEPFRLGLEFGTRNRQAGWGRGLTVLTAMMNLLPHLEAEDRPRALYHGLADVAQETADMAPRFPIRPLPAGSGADLATFKRWFRQFVAVRDDEGAERCVVSALQAGASPAQMADLFFTAVTDFRYIDVGHPADFTNKAFEALDIAGWGLAEQVLPSLVRGYTNAARMEESNAWRYPVDLVTLLETAFPRLADRLDAGESRPVESLAAWRDRLIPILLSDDPAAIVNALLEALAAGCRPVDLASVVSYAAARRIAHFHISNEFGDWDTALHTFTFAHAVEQGLRRSPSVDLLRGVFDAAMSVYLDRFLNIPSTRLPQPDGQASDGQPAERPGLEALTRLLDRQQQVNEAAGLTAAYLYRGGEPAQLLAALGRLLLREDRNFHTIQTVEAAVRQFTRLSGNGAAPADREAAGHVLIAAARYLAAHAPTMRAQGQTFQIARRLHRGERLFEGDPG